MAIDSSALFTKHSNQLYKSQITHHNRNRPKPPGPIEPGTLIIQDVFTSSQAPKSDGLIPAPISKKSAHGKIVAHAALADGFQGDILETRIPGTRAGDFQSQQYDKLTTKNLNKDEAKMALHSYVGSSAVTLLDSQSVLLKHHTDRGSRNTSVNISLGTSKARLTQELFSDIERLKTSSDPQKREKGRILYENQITAFDLDESKLNSKDSKVRNAERKKHIDGLLAMSDDAIGNNPQVKRSQKRFETEVKRYEAQNSSVYVATGNAGGFEAKLRAEFPGQSLDIPKDFSVNVMENDDVTKVGATRWRVNNGQLSEHRANYNSQTENTDIYASGSVGFIDPQRKETMGTSFSAPRLSAIGARLHEENPDWSSDQVEDYIKKNLTHQLTTPDGKITVLDYEKSYSFNNLGVF